MVKYLLVFLKVMESLQPILPILALIGSGFAWTIAGYIPAWRNRKNNPDWKGFEPKKLRDDLLLGLTLGVGSLVYMAVTNTPYSIITNVNEFLIAVGAGFGIVAAVDKLFVGGILNK